MKFITFENFTERIIFWENIGHQIEYAKPEHRWGQQQRKKKKKRVCQEVISKNNSKSRQFDWGILSDFQGEVIPTVFNCSHEKKCVKAFQFLISITYIES